MQNESEHGGEVTAVSQGMRTLLLALYILVCTVGILANGFVILTVQIGRMRASSCSRQIVSLAIADLLSCAFFLTYMPWTMLLFRFRWHYGGAWLCKGLNYVTAVAMLASPFTITSIAIAQCLAMRSLRKLPGKQRLAGRLPQLAVWLLAACVCVPILIFHTTYYYFVPRAHNQSEAVLVCGWQPDAPQAATAFALLLFLVEFALPGCLVTFSSVAVCFSLKRSLSTTVGVRSHSKRQRQLWCIFTCMTGLFVLLRLPVQLVNWLRFGQLLPDKDYAMFYLHFRLWSPLLIVLSYALDPFLYASLSSDFHVAAAKLLGMLRNRQSANLTVSQRKVTSSGNGNEVARRRLITADDSAFAEHNDAISATRERLVSETSPKIPDVQFFAASTANSSVVIFS